LARQRAEVQNHPAARISLTPRASQECLSQPRDNGLRSCRSPTSRLRSTGDLSDHALHLSQSGAAIFPIQNVDECPHGKTPSDGGILDLKRRRFLAGFSGHRKWFRRMALFVSYAFGSRTAGPKIDSAASPSAPVIRPAGRRLTHSPVLTSLLAAKRTSNEATTLANDRRGPAFGLNRTRWLAKEQQIQPSAESFGLLAHGGVTWIGEIGIKAGRRVLEKG
jgi:hypothetical protein